MSINRRDFLKGGVAAGLAGALPGGTLRAQGAPDRSSLPVGRARNIIFFAYDGFGFEDLATARFFSHREMHGRPLAIERLLARGGSGGMLPHSLTSIVTDSSAASAAWSTGRKIVNRYVSMYPDGRKLTTILELAKRQGRATGVITTTRLTHATPAAWIAHVVERDLEDDIALEYLQFGADVMLGGGSRHFDHARRADGQDLFVGFQAKGYGVVRTAEQLAASNASRLLGTFTVDHLPFEIDRRYQNVPSPSLADMVRKGLQVLSGNPNGFVVQIEAGRIDHANHDNDPGAMIWDVMAADEALIAAMEFVDRTPDTVLIVASDHDTGGGVVYGVGTGYLRTNAAFDRLARRRSSHEYLARVLGPDPSLNEVEWAIQELMQVPLATRAETARAREIIARRMPMGHRYAHGSAWSPALNQFLTSADRDVVEHLNINFATGAHTAGVVPLAVYGAGTDTGGLGIVDNVELFDWLLATLGMEFENPLMTEEEALRLLAEVQQSSAPPLHPGDSMVLG
jgi:alkaline phosphatase